MAALSYYSYGLDPLSEKLMRLRLNMIEKFIKIDEKRVFKEFLNERIYKLGTLKTYSYEQAAFAYNLPLS